MRLAFMGTPDFAAKALDALVAAGHEIAAAYCQPPKPANRGHQLQKSAVQIMAEEQGLPVYTPKTLRYAEAQAEFAALHLDVAVVAAYGLILPEPILQAPRLGCINIHASLLPRWRGAAPIQRAILAGDTESGVTIMQMDKGLDTGPMLMRGVVPITPTTTSATLHDALAELGSHLIVKTLSGLKEGTVQPETQPETGVTYAEKLSREDGRVDWHQPAALIERQLRALHPWPGCFFDLEGQTIKLLSAEIVTDKNGKPGEILDDEMTIACGQDALRLLRVQRPNKSAVSGAEFLRGWRGELIRL